MVLVASATSYLKFAPDQASEEDAHLNKYLALIYQVTPLNIYWPVQAQTCHGWVELFLLKRENMLEKFSF